LPNGGVGRSCRTLRVLRPPAHLLQLLVWGFVCQALCGNDPRGARPLGAKHRAATLYSVGSVLDPDHEAVIRFDGEAPGGGPILPTASKPWSCSGHRHLGSSLTASRESAIGRQSYAFALLDHLPRLGRRPQHNADRDFAGHDQAPQRDQQFPSECHDHRRLAHALRAFGPRPIPLRQCAVLLEP
jgi:hypothetical protein